jgi:arylsulfatase A-like enzyme
VTPSLRIRPSIPAAWVAAGIVGVAAALSGCGASHDPSTRTELDFDELHGLAAGSSLLIISIDTLRADHLGCYGYGAAATPNIDALAARGVRFEQAISAAPITLVSHTTLLTGLDPPSHGVRLNGTFRLSDDHTTLAETLRSSGYATAAVVGAFVLDARYGLSQGFDHYDDDFLPSLQATDSSLYSARPADAVTATAIAWLTDHLRGSSPRPFFLWVHYYDPHFPHEPPAAYAQRFPDRPYDGEIAFVDEQIGRLLEFLRGRGILEDTLIVVVGDHGEGLGEHGEATHLDLVYDSTMRVPWIVAGAGMPQGRVVSDRVAGLVDVLPTVLGLLGIDSSPAAVDGQDLTRVSADADRALYIESLAGYLDYGWAPLHGLRRLHDKLILSPDPEYFDVGDDPGEQVNLYGSSDAADDLEKRLGKRLAEWAPVSAAREAEHAPDQEALDRLAALGYVRRAPDEGSAGADPKAMLEVGNQLQTAISLSAAGDLEGALAAVEAVLAEHPDAPRALYAATAIYDRMGRLDDGERTLRRALNVRPNAEGWVHQAWYAFMRRDFDLFEAALGEAERLDPMDGGIYISRGHRAALEGRLEEAVRMFEKAAEVDPVRVGAQARENIRIVRESLGARP